MGPVVELERANPRQVRAQIAVNAGAFDAYERAVIQTSPDRIGRVAVHALAVARHAFYVQDGARVGRERAVLGLELVGLVQLQARADLLLDRLHPFLALFAARRLEIPISRGDFYFKIYFDFFLFVCLFVRE